MREFQVKASELETATLGGGCFWCTEAVFQQIGGILSVTSGYSGGTKPDPTYQEVCTGATGHAEVVQVIFDPAKITYREILELFWRSHDPTTLNRQGPDEGTQYRSVIFYHTEEQRKLAEDLKAELSASGRWDSPSVTEIRPFMGFYKAEEYHQNYYSRNPHQGYCRVMIQPKLEKIRKEFSSKLKKDL